jgi:hypothetical protein
LEDWYISLPFSPSKKETAETTGPIHLEAAKEMGTAYPLIEGRVVIVWRAGEIQNAEALKAWTGVLGADG